MCVGGGVVCVCVCACMCVSVYVCVCDTRDLPHFYQPNKSKAMAQLLLG